jgi:acyl carrier protein
MTGENWRIQMLRELQPIFRELFGDERLVISEKTSPADIEEWDSMAHVTLLTEVEKRFGVRFTAEEMGRTTDVSALLDVLHQHGSRSD